VRRHRRSPPSCPPRCWPSYLGPSCSPRMLPNRNRRAVPRRRTICSLPTRTAAASASQGPVVLVIWLSFWTKLVLTAALGGYHERHADGRLGWCPRRAHDACRVDQPQPDGSLPAARTGTTQDEGTLHRRAHDATQEGGLDREGPLLCRPRHGWPSVLAGASLPQFSERRVGNWGRDKIYIASFNLGRTPLAGSCGCLQVDECLSFLLSVKISSKRKINAKET
jgi:hypothetical protein